MVTPADRNPIIGDWGYDWFLTGFGDGESRGTADALGVGIFMYPDTHNEYVWGLYGTFDLALSLYSRSTAYKTSEKPLFPILKAFCGGWWWVESPHNVGVMTGLRAGVGKRICDDDPGRAVLLEYGYTALYNVAHGESTEVEIVTLSVVWAF